MKLLMILDVIVFVSICVAVIARGNFDAGSQALVFICAVLAFLNAVVIGMEISDGG
jgi:hypothetical protein